MTQDNDGLVILLTGTAIANGSHEDLISQLDILGALEEVAQPKYGNAKKAFKNQFMAFNEETRRYEGSKNGSLLQDRLRTSGRYIRREKSQVLTDLPPLRRNAIPLSLNGALDTYRRIESEFLAWVEEQGGREAAQRAARAETIARLGALKHEVGRAKIKAALEWVAEFRQSRPDASLVVFAVYKDVQAALVEGIEAMGETVVHLGAGLSKNPERARELTEAFQAGDAKIAVCSVLAAGVGLTLTRADTVLMVEQHWTPKDADQAEARIHRPGQESDKVEAVTLLGEDTYDEDLRAIVDHKREVFMAAMVGEEFHGDAGGYGDVEGNALAAMDRLMARRGA